MPDDLPVPTEFPARKISRAQVRPLAALVALAACGDASGDDGDAGAMLDAGPEPVRALFAPGEDPMPFGVVPWPDDLYLDAAGHVAVTALPGPAQARSYLDALALGLSDLDGFGAFGPVYFHFDGALDPTSLPSDPSDSIGPEASVFLIDADTGSPTAFERVAVEVRLAEDGESLALRPTRPLIPGRRYAAVVTREVRSVEGRPVDGSARFLAVRNPALALEDSHEREARTRYTPVLETLVAQGLPRDEVAALAVFRVQTIEADLEDARTLVRADALVDPSISVVSSGDALDDLLGMPGPTAIGASAPGGVPHEHVGTLVHGTFEAPSLLSADGEIHGAFERSEAGELRVKRTAQVPFSLVLPAGAFDASALPVVFFLHGFGRERSDGLTAANALAASGYAVFLVDAPFHGSRVAGSDTAHRFTGAPGADGFGDVVGDVVGALDRDGSLVPLHPFYYRDAVRQGVVDLTMLARLVDDADWSQVLAAAEPSLRDVGFDATRIGVVGIDLGAELAMMLASVEPAVGALALAFVGGPTLDGWTWSPARTALVEAWAERVGRDAAALRDPDDPPRFWPESGVWQALVDRADPLVHATRLRARPVSVLLWMARDDEVVHDRSTEALGLALGTEVVGGEPRHEADLATASIGAGATASGNFAIGDEAVTRILSILEPATHETLHAETGSAAYVHPIELPFEPLDSPTTVDNPTAEVLTQLVFYFESWRACTPASSGAACPASVLVP